MESWRGSRWPINLSPRSSLWIVGVDVLRVQQQWRLCSSLGLYVRTSSTGSSSLTQPYRQSLTPRTLCSAVLAYNHSDLELIIKAVRTEDLETLKSVSEEDVVRCYIPAHPHGHRGDERSRWAGRERSEPPQNTWYKRPHTEVITSLQIVKQTM